MREARSRTLVAPRLVPDRLEGDERGRRVLAHLGGDGGGAGAAPLALLGATPGLAFGIRRGLECLGPPGERRHPLLQRAEVQARIRLLAPRRACPLGGAVPLGGRPRKVLLRLFGFAGRDVEAADESREFGPVLRALGVEPRDGGRGAFGLGAGGAEDGPELVYSGAKRMNVVSNEEAFGRRGGGNTYINVTTPNADSFRASQRQIARRAKQTLGADS